MSVVGGWFFGLARTGSGQGDLYGRYVSFHGEPCGHDLECTERRHAEFHPGNGVDASRILQHLLLGHQIFRGARQGFLLGLKALRLVSDRRDLHAHPEVETENRCHRRNRQDDVEKIKKASRVGARPDSVISGFDAASQVKEIPQVIKMGVGSFKMFMTYAKLKWMTDDYYLAAAMDLIAENGGLAIVHAESGLAIDYLEDKYLKLEGAQKDVFLKSRPDVLEAEATFRAISIAEAMDCPIYIAHVSAARAVPIIRMAREEGRKVYAETCPQYLTLTDDEVRAKGPLAKIGPPLRVSSDNEALWEAVRNSVIDVIASDHAPKAKNVDDDFFEAPFGSPSAETLLTVSYDEVINRGRIDLCCLARVLSENPARIFGLFPKKGTTRQGSDADLVVFDPSRLHTIAQKTQHSLTPYTLYEGRQCLGAPILTMQRGKVIVENNELRGQPGSAEFLPTSKTYDRR